MLYQPYQKLALVYDKIYVRQGSFFSGYAVFINKVIKENGIKNAKILDIACGTGELIRKLKKENIRIEGVDLSGEMIEIAKKRNRGVKFYVCDLANFRLNKKYDLITCTFDSINYITSKRDLRKTFRNVAKHLNKGGIFVFDFNTIYKKVKEKMIQEGVVFISKMRGRNWNIEIIIKKGNKIFKERHRERLYSLKEIESAISENEMKIAEVYSDFKNKIKEPDKYQRLIVVAKRAFA